MSLFEVDDKGDVMIHGHLNRTTLSGNFWQDLSSSEQNILVKAKHSALDLSKVERVDSAGLAWLINAVRDAKQNGVSITLLNMPIKLHKLAKLSNADSFLPVKLATN